MKPLHLVPAALFAAASLASLSAHADDVPAKGQVDVKKVKVDGTDTPKFVVRKVMDVAPKKVWAVVSDCAHYKDRLPRVAASELVKKDGNTFTCKVTIKVPFPMSNLTAVTEAHHEESARAMKRSWKLVSGDYTRNEGSWEVKALDDAGTKSLVTYSVLAEPKSSVPDFIRESAQAKALPELMERVENEASKM